MYVSSCNVTGHFICITFRPLSYQDTSAFVVCFSTSERGSFDHVREKWVPEIRHFCGSDIPVVVAGSKTDLRDSRQISESEGQRLTKEVKAQAYVEFSAHNRTGVEKVFESAFKAVYKKEGNSGFCNACGKCAII